VQGSGFRVQGSGFRVQGSGFRVQGSGFRVQGSGFRLKQQIDVKISDSNTPTMGEQSQIISVRLVSARPDLGFCLRLVGDRDKGQ
jgi:hypothetical protein